MTWGPGVQEVVGVVGDNGVDLTDILEGIVEVIAADRPDVRAVGVQVKVLTGESDLPAYVGAREREMLATQA
jgi:hypothetical protein